MDSSSVRIFICLFIIIRFVGINLFKTSTKIIPMNAYGLNDEQWDAITCSSPVFCQASAGAGKTRCLISKIRYLIDHQNAQPGNICAITFTNKAANEMKERLKKHADVSQMQISTIHSMSVRIIKAFIHSTYLKIPFTIYDDGDQLSVMKTIVKARELPGDPYEYLHTLSKHKSEDRIPTDEIQLEIFNQYQEILKINNSCDFDDLLIFARNCLKNEQCQNYFSGKWQHILVDEVQDTSKVQFEIVRLLFTEKTKTMFVVGDKSQAVYGWRNARPENIDDFIKDYNANVRFLTYNYRSCPEVISMANGFQQFGKPMISKSSFVGKVSMTVFNSKEEEADKIAQALLKMGNYEDTAVIYRINTRSLLFEQTFSRYRIPYKVVNELGFFQRKVCKDLLSALKAANNEDDRESLCRVINNPKRGFGDAKKEQLLMHGRQYVEEIANEMPQIRTFLDLLEDIKGVPPAHALEQYLNKTGYLNTIEKDSDRFMIDSLRNAVIEYDSVDELILASTFLERDAEKGVNLITAHGSKGLEYEKVFVVGVENELWPHKNSLDILEEERLFYVACTRAKRYLNISYSQSKKYRGTPIQTFPSQLFKLSYKAIHGQEYL
jgi:DNA helicase II / ATP-dependent DNA helicase PcrA